VAIFPVFDIAVFGRPSTASKFGSSSFSNGNGATTPGGDEIEVDHGWLTKTTDLLP
jgi:hypothetical protein